MIIFIRHGDDEFQSSDDQTYAHDCKVKKKGIKEVGEELIIKYGSPSYIFVSPMRRGRITGKQLNKVAQCKLKVVSHLSRHFTSQEKKDVDVDPETGKYNLFLHEDLKTFNRRCKKVYYHLTDLYGKSKEVVWIVTHAMVLKRIAKLANIKLPKKIPFVYYFSI